MDTSVPQQTQTRNLLIFWLRIIGWFLTGCVAPIIVFATKFGLFKSTYIMTDSLGNQITQKSYALNGWGIISCFIIGYTMISVMKEVIKSYQGYSLTKQVLEGILKSIIPLMIAYGICYFLHDTIEQIMFCLAIVIITRAIAIPLNPLPKWRFEKNGAEDYSDFLTEIVKSIKAKR